MKAYDIEIIRFLKQKCHLLGENSLFELVESSVDLFTEDICEQWWRGRVLRFKAIAFIFKF